jgi:hypothetical protein
MTRFRFSMIAAAAVSAVVLGASAPRTEASSVYAFSEQKVYNMYMQPSNPGTLTNANLSIATTTSATLNGIGTGSNLPVLDALQSFLGDAAFNPVVQYGPAIGQNFSTTTPFAAPGSNATVLTQSVGIPALPPGTPWGAANTTVNGVPAITDLPAVGTFTRSDVLTRIPPASNQGVDPNWLFTQGFTGNPPVVPAADANISMDSAAEGLITGFGVGSANSNWTISGGFTLTAQDTVSLMFNYINRLVSFDNASGSELGVADSSLDFSLDIKDAATGQSVFGGATPSYASLLSHTYPPISGSATRNENTLGITNSLGGINFVSPLLNPGVYSFSITGNTRVNVSLVPEPSSFIMMGLGIVAVGGLRVRRRMLNRKASAE